MKSERTIIVPNNIKYLSEVKEIQEEYYKSLDVIPQTKTKATHLSKWFEITRSPKRIEGKTVSAYKIVKGI